jgi:CheY-like chemotaxis protein
MPSLARAYGVSPHTRLEHRLDLFDLVWATRAVLSGALPARQVQVAQDRVRYFFEFLSYRKNPIDPEACAVVAELKTESEPGCLHLSLPGELPSTVLIIEDDPDLAALIRLILEESGFHTLTADTGKRGFQAAVQHHPDLILLDIDLPDTNGFEVFALLRAEPKTSGIPIVFCSGRLDAPERAAQLGAAGCLRKPDDFPQLALQLQRVLGQG